MTTPESQAAAVLGRKGGRSKSEAKCDAAWHNGRLGGASKHRCICGHKREAHIASVCGVCECSNFVAKS